MTCAHRSQSDLDHARAQGYEAFYEGMTPADVPFDEYAGLVRDWWLSGWRAARQDSGITGVPGPGGAA